jgi:hypothetical protein
LSKVSHCPLGYSDSLDDFRAAINPEFSRRSSLIFRHFD